MQLPKLAPLQSRLLASVATTCLVVTLWISFQPQSFAYAAEIVTPPEYILRSEFELSISPILPDDPPIVTGGAGGEVHNEALYMPDFAYFERSLVGRQEDEVTELNNNQKVEMVIMPNTTRHFRFKKSQLVNKRTVVAEEDFSTTTNSRNTLDDRSEPVRVYAGDGDKNNDGLEGGAFDNQMKKRQTRGQLWISANTCRQPTPTVMLVTDPPPQLTLWVWTSTNSAKPQPSTNSNAKRVEFQRGYVDYTLSADADIFIAVSAPALTQGWNGTWQFEVAATVDKGHFHGYNISTDFIFMVDTDSDSALFITHDLTTTNDSAAVTRWTDLGEQNKIPLTMYAFPEDTWSKVMGLEQSYCGLQEQFKTTNNLSVEHSITTKFGDTIPRGQFHVQGLKTATKYRGFLAATGGGDGMMLSNNITIQSGGTVFKQFNWTTKADDSCQVIFDLDFCDTVAYAVPSSSQFKNNDTGLKTIYDDLAAAYMKNFSRSLAQIACDTASTARYSLTRNCTDCANDYKSWLCSVVIPRCEDFSVPDPWLQPRNIAALLSNGSQPFGTNNTVFNDTHRNRYAFNRSRIPMIDEIIKPGPYKELLPCEDLCFDIVRSCPAQLGFSCPNDPLRQYSYGKKDPTEMNLKCNFPGAVVNLNLDRGAAGTLAARWSTTALVSFMTIAWTWI